ncbi:MAG: ribonucleoside-diphosphate reductase subunit alpha [Spirochaetales bacterium]|nr:ribonucleoside-diphosphate reductase subunit alpha [Spirochaetales bacterium]
MVYPRVRKRTGELVAFDLARVVTAVERAFDAAGEDADEALFERIGEEIGRRFRGSEGPVDIETIQDAVEETLMGNQLFTVSRRYIIYRQRRADARERRASDSARKVFSGDLTVQKRNHAAAPFDLGRIEETLGRHAGDLGEVDYDLILTELKRNIYDGVATPELEEALILSVTAFIERDPQYNRLASRLVRQKLYREVFGRSVDATSFDEAYRTAFCENIRRGVEAGLYAPKLAERFDLEDLASYLQLGRDDDLLYLGAQTLYERYFLKLKGRPIETPQHFWMRVAMGLAVEEAEPDRRAREFYDLLSGLRFVSSTPTLFHAGTPHPQLSSCYLSTVEDDLEHIFKCIGDNAQMSKWSGGIGNDWSYIRATGAAIKSTKVESQGVIPFLKIANDTTVAINRSGKRRGATCAYLETWHLDIEDFLDLRRNTGDDRRRTHDMNTANWIPDLFMKRVGEESHWTLFSPEEVSDLHDLYGRAFEERYLEYERLADEGKIQLWRRVEAVKLWRKMLTRLFETGHPWITFKDPSNIRSPQDHVGVVHNSNLCTEITLNNSAEETAVCNLGSINLARHVDDAGLNHFLLRETVHTAMRMLDNVVDINFYPTVEARTSNLRHRPVGLGLMGLQDALFTLGLPIDDERARTFVDESMEFISYHAILGSSDLAAERGSYSTFQGSKWDRGLFPIDTLDLLEAERGVDVPVDRTRRLDWDALKATVSRQGMRNSNTMAIAPTATISNIAGVYPSIEPIYKNLYVKANMSGEFTVINEYLVRDLKRHGLWNGEMLEQLKYHDGNIAHIAGIPAELKELHREAFDIDPTALLELTAYRGKWIDQSQSHNVFIRGTSGKKLHETYTAAWRLGLKTTYYLRSLGASQIEKSTLDAAKYGFTQKRDATPTSSPAAAEERASQATEIGAARATGSAEIRRAAGAEERTTATVIEATRVTPATEVTNICSLTDPECESCQ